MGWFFETVDAVNSTLLDAAGEPWALLALFALCTADGLFPVVPSESLVVGFGTLAASTGEPIAVVAVVAAAGATLGDNLTFALGRMVGTDRFRWMRTPRAAAAFSRAEATLERRSASLVLTARFIPAARVAAYLAAGASAMPRRRFLLLSMTAGSSWAVFNIGIGVLAGQWVENNALLGMALAIGLALAVGLVVDRVISLTADRRARHDSPRPQRCS
ncbi:DedA family protein [Aeromicrobium sp. CTD01-1L150]|uniref:DedA family protein n=1 Tax=Aeromicrobium sp. CTD01-1L150 TaxID=3341830 RepID=UPI0035C15E74